LTSNRAVKGAAERWLPGAVFKILALAGLIPLQHRDPYVELFSGKRGLEVGGPSVIFKPWGAIPLYPVVAGLDGCNFATHTAWEGTVRSGVSYEFLAGRKGFQFILEATNLAGIPAGAYDFVLSSHCLEHMANPLRALSEWLRVTKDGGLLLVVVPDRERTFDHRRSVTSFEHLLDDFTRGIGEDDMTHLAEILALHDIVMDPGASSMELFAERARDNAANRCLHHHVFDQVLLGRIFTHLGLEILVTERIEPLHIVTLGRKACGGLEARI
jgi:SAM-dependent methyltransferase